MDTLVLADDLVTHIDGSRHRTARAAAHATGPPGILQGGLVAGLLMRAARSVDRLGAPTTTVDAQLHAPTPVGRELGTRTRRVTGAVYETEVVDGDAMLASGTVELAGRDPVPRVADLVELAGQPVPTPEPGDFATTCWVCGRDNPEGLGLFPGWLPGGAVLQGWAPGPELGDASGHVDEAVVCAVLDCPTVWCALDRIHALGFTGALLARLHVQFFRPAPVMEPLRIVARLDQADGRKLHARSALVDEDGGVHAVASALQIAADQPPA